MRYIYCALAFSLLATATFMVSKQVKCFGYRGSCVKHDVHLLNQFQSYVRDFNKHYSDENYLKRLQNFQVSLREISRLNAIHGSKVFGLTKFSDMSASEFRKKMLSESPLGECKEWRRDKCPPSFGRGMKSPRAGHRLLKNNTGDIDGSQEYLDTPLPMKVNWTSTGVVFPVLDQKQCLGCWAFSIVGVMESMAALEGKGKTQRSVQELLDCSTYNNGCSRGDIGLALDFLCINDYSVVTEKQYPLTLVTEACRIPKNHKPHGRRVEKYYSICNVNEKTILQLLANHGPVVAVVNAAPWQNYAGGVIQYECASDSEYDAPSVVSEVPPPKKKSKSSSAATKRKTAATVAVKTTETSPPYETVSSRRKQPKRDLFNILRSEETASSRPKPSAGTATSSFASRVSTGTSRRTAVSSGEYFVDLKVYKTNDYVSNPVEVRYKTALASVRLQCEDTSPSWEALQGFLAQAWEVFENSEPVYYSDKINFK